jgi:predicted metal-dependent phosphotriesterase family hydrolase
MLLYSNWLPAAPRPHRSAMGEEELDYETEHVLTVAGPVRPETLGPTLAAEHLVHSCADLHTPLPPAEVEEGAERRRLRLALAQARLTMDMLVDVRRHPFASLVNLRMDAEDASGELLRWTRCGESGGVSSGGGCAAAVLAPTSAVLEVTPRHRGRDVAAVSRLAAALPQVHVVLGTGCVAALVRLHFTPWWCCAPPCCCYRRTMAELLRTRPCRCPPAGAGGGVHRN